MNVTLDEILAASHDAEFSQYDNAPEHVFSRKHNRAMKRIFKLFEKNTRRLGLREASEPRYRVRLTKKTALVILTVIFLAVLAGCAVTYFVSQDFHGKVYSDNTELFVINAENCPATIEKRYYLPNLPENFEPLSTDSTPFCEYISYQNKATRQTISFWQRAKSELDSYHYNTENIDFEEIEINGHHCLFLDFSSDEYYSTSCIWDNGDYIIAISGDISKNEMIELAKSTKVLEK